MLVCCCFYLSACACIFIQQVLFAVIALCDAVTIIKGVGDGVGSSANLWIVSDIVGVVDCVITHFNTLI